MTDWLIGLVPQYGSLLLAVTTFCSCLALPLPASIMMIVAGGFVSAGDLSLVGSAGGALAGAVIGDQVGYFAGRWGGTRVLERLASRSAAIGKATIALATRGLFAVFFSRWLVSALGPYVNVAAGAASLPWLRFTISGVLGEVVWVSLYVGAGFVFSGNLEAATGATLDMLGMLAAGAIAIGLAYWLATVLRAESHDEDPVDPESSG